MRLHEIKQLLLARQYPESLVDIASQKAKQIPRRVALFKVKEKNLQKQTKFLLKYDPRIPNIQSVIAKHYKTMVAEDKYLKRYFTQPPLRAQRRQNNLNNFLIQSKEAPPHQLHPQREMKSMKKCGKACTACPFILTGKFVKIDQQQTWKIEKKFNYESFNIIYLIQCRKCDKKIPHTGDKESLDRCGQQDRYKFEEVA